MTDKKFKPNDRVKRANAPGCFGRVKELRSEVTSSSVEAKDSNLMVSVLWDTGTLSYFSPDALELVEEGK